MFRFSLRTGQLVWFLVAYNLLHKLSVDILSDEQFSHHKVFFHIKVHLEGFQFFVGSPIKVFSVFEFDIYPEGMDRSSFVIFSPDIGSGFVTSTGWLMFSQT